jgi:hypothetical protein
MSDIFFSYAPDDIDQAEKLRDTFLQQGWTVWNGPVTVHADAYNDRVDRALKEAKVVVVLWSHAARKSAFMRNVIERQGRMPPIFVRLEDVDVPDEFRFVRSFKIQGRVKSAGPDYLPYLLHHLHTLINPSTAPAAPPVSFEDLSLSEIQENIRRVMQQCMSAQPKGKRRFRGVFISYRRIEAAAYARGIYDRLAARFSREKVFLDMENVPWGEDFVEAIKSAADSCAVMIVLISRQWLRGKGEEEGLDDYVRLEVATALKRKIRVVPILIQGASMPSRKELPEDLLPLLPRNALALNDTRWERDVEDLIQSLESLLKN